jgi:hypothetical protein
LWAVSGILGADTACTSVISAGRAGVTLRALRTYSSAASIIAADSLATRAWKDRFAEVRRADTAAISTRNEVATWIIGAGLSILFGEGSDAEEVALGTETIETLNRSVRRARSECAVCGSRVNTNARGTEKWSVSRTTIGEWALALWSTRSVRAEHGIGWAGKVGRVVIARC